MDIDDPKEMNPKRFYTVPATALANGLDLGTLIPCYSEICDNIVPLRDSKSWVYWDGNELIGGAFCSDECALKIMPVAELTKQ